MPVNTLREQSGFKERESHRNPVRSLETLCISKKKEKKKKKRQGFTT